MLDHTLAPRKVQLTTRHGVEISRFLPHRSLRAIGAWVFLDYYGPTDHIETMSVGAHPHVGLQTLSWLFSGEIEHRDSLGSVQEIAPGSLNLMTAGRGIAHSELSLATSSQLHGVQLWTALPEAARTIAPTFDHHSTFPVITHEQISIHLFMGEFLGERSPAKCFSPMMGAEVLVAPQSSATLPLELRSEYGLLLIKGQITIDGEDLSEGQLRYLPAGALSVALSSDGGAQILMLGGEPFTEKIIMWWNFIGREHEEIVQMRAAWNDATELFPEFVDQIAERIPAPELPNLHLTPRSLQR